MNAAVPRFSLSLALFVGLIASTGTAYAYRPFEGTDAAVAEPPEWEIELGPLQYLREGSDRTLITPEITVNYGLAKDWEAVWEGQVMRDVNSDSHHTRFVEHGIFLKHVLREGSLQEGTGPSVATEFGLLLPGIHGDPGTGGRVVAIVSQQWSTLTVHLNTAAAVTRENQHDVFIGAIIEGPHDWTLRPVAEVFHERETESGHTTSTLIGAIWQASKRLNVDFGWREARTNDQRLEEIRAGVTYSFSPS